MQRVYSLCQATFGGVIGPASVYWARLPVGFFQFYATMAELDRELVLPPELALLVRHQVSRLNGCPFCTDATRAGALRASMDASKFDHLAAYESDPGYTDRERVALDYVTELTRTRRMRPETFARLAERFSEREICELVYLVASQFLGNIGYIGLHIGSDGLSERVARTPPPGPHPSPSP